jgi:predicted phosphatase
MEEKNKPNRDQLPDEFETFEELSTFWDSHDVTDYEDQLTAVSVEVTSQPTHEYKIVLSDTLNKIIREAQKQEGVSIGTLVNLWVQEKLQQYQTAS